MDRHPRKPAPHDAQGLKVLGHLGKQRTRPADLTVAGGLEIGWRPWAFLQIPEIDLARGAGEKNEDAVARAVLQRRVRRADGAVEQGRIEHISEVRRDQSRAGDLQKSPPGESWTERQAAGLTARRTFDLAPHQSNRNSRVFISAYCRSSARSPSGPSLSSAIAICRSLAVGLRESVAR